MTMKRVQTNGIELAVLDEGTGDPVLLLHGFPDDHHVWRKQVGDLVSAGYRVIAPDLRGCGQSDMPSRTDAYKIPLLLADITGLLDALGIARVSLVAHDWGAVIGWQFCMAHPDRVTRYAALSVGHPVAYARGSLIQKIKGWYVLMFQLRGIAETLLRAGNWFAFRHTTGCAEELPYWIANLSRPGRLTAGIDYYRANFGTLFGRPANTRVPMPVLGVWSDRDRYLCRKQMTGSADFVDGGFRYVELPGVGHWITIDAAREVNALLLEFLGEPTQ